MAKLVNCFTKVLHTDDHTIILDKDGKPAVVNRISDATAMALTEFSNLVCDGEKIYARSGSKICCFQGDSRRTVVNIPSSENMHYCVKDGKIYAVIDNILYYPGGHIDDCVQVLKHGGLYALFRDDGGFRLRYPDDSQQRTSCKYVKLNEIDGEIFVYGFDGTSIFQFNKPEIIKCGYTMVEIRYSGGEKVCKEVKISGPTSGLKFEFLCGLMFVVCDSFVEMRDQRDLSLIKRYDFREIEKVLFEESGHVYAATEDGKLLKL